MLRLELSLQFGPWSIGLGLTPLSWDWKPYDSKYWDPDFDNMTEGSRRFYWLCFSLRVEKRMNLAKMLLTNKK